MIRVCACCNANFEVTEFDLAFYDKVSAVFKGVKYEIPPPTLCSECRQQRRLTFRNERNLYHRACDLCKKNIVSLYSPESHFVVYCQKCWWGDTWDPLCYGRDFDFGRSFFEQFQELQRIVPRSALFNLNSINSEYTNHSANNKNCYMGVAFGECEDCMYGHWVLNSRNVFDSLYVERCDQCYECSYCINCFSTFFSQYCQNTRDCLICYDCKDCEYCIGCVQLQHKKYYVLNQPVSPSEYHKLKHEILTSKEKFSEFFARYQELKLRSPHRAVFQLNCENSIGDDLYNCKDSNFCFNCRNLQDCKYMFDLGNNKDSMDCYEHGWLVPSELVYESHAGMAGYHLLFCNICAYSRDLIYCDLCFNNSAYLFGCIALRKKSYCVLNKQHTKEEYEDLVSRIIEHMKQDGTYGEFFPSAISPFGYNETPAQEYYPYARDEAQLKGFNWSDYKPPLPHVKEILSADSLPRDINQVSDDILSHAISCEVTKRPFIITKQELQFYREHQIPLPRRHPDQRHKERMALRNPRRLWDRQCAKCGKEIKTTYAPERHEVVYCEECYLKQVY